MKSTGPLDAEAIAMGARIRGLRIERGLTLVRLAGETGMSQPFLSLVERGHARLSLASMAKIARGLGVPPGSLLARPSADRHSGAGTDVVHADVPRTPEGVRTVWQLAQLPGGLFGTEMHGTEMTFSEYAEHDEDEFLYVLAGTLEVGLDDGTVHRLSPGSSLAVAAGVAHGWRAIDSGGYRVLTVTSGGDWH
ncbi:MAG: XRE family transcriptional regulator [Herbiconiux sp.]|uniref:helix-turn-helix domain-containing protein n=1 Tax=Herbiconiux sp. TaxID=1871186 RepID=UPI00120FBA6E|nr:XRE family transcriptional regulator [Herbiconiux sp.]TAJ46705.1 MAG: XRE family transcriptional regulator [Herbiconiux sp.]